MKFQDLTGNRENIKALKSLVDKGTIPHAILISGISGIGKMQAARALAQYIHCKNPIEGEVCGKCPSCLQHQNHNNPDLHFIFPVVKKDGVQISKDQMDLWREMIDKHSLMPPEIWNEIIKAGNSQPSIYVQESEDILTRASLSSFQENYKIFIIWQPEKLRPEAANKLLKVIEEPFEDTIFILVSNNDNKILPTILSRTQRFNFTPLTESEIKDFLVKKGIDDSKASEVARISEGSLRKAEELASFPEELLEFSDIFKDMMRSAYALKAKNLKEISETVSAFGREKILRFLDYCSRMIRENYIFNFNVPNITLMTAEETDFSAKFAPFIHDGNVEQLSEEINRAARDIERNGNSKIVLFDLMLLFSRLIRKPKAAVLPRMEL